MKNLLKSGLVCMLVSLSLTLSAQQHDSTRIMRDFISVSNGYKQQRYQLNVQLQNTANVITDPNDTINTTAVFYITPSVSYSRFGNIEQIVSDSLALTVNDGEERMVLYSAAASVTARLNVMHSLHVSDSSITVLHKKFMVSETQADSATQTIIMSSRARVHGSNLAMLSNELLYDVTTQNPISVKTIRRSLVHIDASDLPGVPDSLTVVEIDHEHYIVKEVQTLCRFISIGHNATMESPVNITERIARTPDGAYVPTGSFSHYQLIHF